MTVIVSRRGGQKDWQSAPRGWQKTPLSDSRSRKRDYHPPRRRSPTGGPRYAKVLAIRIEIHIETHWSNPSQRMTVLLLFRGGN